MMKIDMQLVQKFGLFWATMSSNVPVSVVT